MYVQLFGTVFLMSVQFSWFIILLQLVCELSKDGAIINVAITGLAILTRAFAFVVVSAWNILPAVNTGFFPSIQSHFPTYVTYQKGLS